MNSWHKYKISPVVYLFHMAREREIFYNEWRQPNGMNSQSAGSTLDRIWIDMNSILIIQNYQNWDGVVKFLWSK